MRGEIDPALLRGGSPEELIEAAVDAGLVGEQGLGEVALGDVQVEGDRATAPAVVRGRSTPLTFAFLREDGRWKVDLQPLLRVSDEALRAQADQQGISTDKLVDSLLAARYGAGEATDLREPLAPRR